MADKGRYLLNATSVSQWESEPELPDVIGHMDCYLSLYDKEQLLLSCLCSPIVCFTITQGYAFFFLFCLVSQVYE